VPNKTQPEEGQNFEKAKKKEKQNRYEQYAIQIPDPKIKEL